MKALSYYDLLQVAPDAATQRIKAQYRHLSRLYHPDKGGSDEAFKYLKFVHDVLVDPELRNLYDTSGKAAFDGSDAGDGGIKQSAFNVKRPPVNYDFLRFLQRTAGAQTAQVAGRPLADNIEHVLSLGSKLVDSYKECNLARKLDVPLRLVGD